ncbi:MAG: DUF1214 domain-containing protein [Deltaproteobacteria bacterium]|nr:DUF1214 domain-containing protein [Deltaproteobacteria bacterium]
MDRRDFLLGGAAGFGALAAHELLAPSSARALPEGASASSDGSESGAALQELREVLGQLEAAFATDAWGLRGPMDQAEARRLVMFHLHHAIEVYFEPSPERPAWKRAVTPEKKLLGDNPDAIYFLTPVSPEHSYRIRGNLARAIYTSFTVELGGADGSNPSGLGATLNDSEFAHARNGDFEIIASARKPERGNWLRLDPGASSLTTRHYYETKHSIAADQLHHIPLSIERIGSTAPPPPPSDASVAAGIRRVARFLSTTIYPPRRDPAQLPPWVSLVPNQFARAKKDDSNTKIGFAAKDNVYSTAPFVLAPDEALVMRGRFPKCRFANVVLWNRHTVSFDYRYRRISLNRRQTQLERDGSFRIVLAARDPGVANWLDSEGRPSGSVFWRFLLPEEEIAPLETKVVKVGDVKGA